MAQRLDDAGAAELVLFNPFLQPDIDPEAMTMAPGVTLSTSAEGRVPLTWIALLRGRVNASLAATTGVENAGDLIKSYWPGPMWCSRRRRCCGGAPIMQAPSSRGCASG